jgi:hypothetical protein
MAPLVVAIRLQSPDVDDLPGLVQTGSLPLAARVLL